eukprot:UN29469
MSWECSPTQHCGDPGECVDIAECTSTSVEVNNWSILSIDYDPDFTLYNNEQLQLYPEILTTTITPINPTDPPNVNHTRMLSEVSDSECPTSSEVITITYVESKTHSYVRSSGVEISYGYD